MYTELIPYIERWLRHFKIDDQAGFESVYKAADLNKPELEKVYQEFFNRMKDNYPFHLPEYAGQMLKPPHPYAWLAYSLTMMLNPNNHALDGGPATSEMEKEVIDKIGEMFGYKKPFLGHLTGGGTVANLEALWVAGKSHPGKPVLFSEAAHYTHKRMCEVLGLPYKVIRETEEGMMDVEHLKSEIEGAGTVVVTMGTTGRGVTEPLAQIVSVCKKHGVRIHLDAAYGGFFKLVEGRLHYDNLSWAFTNLADSIVVDPHKHGLQPYGCGAVLFKDPEVGSFYKHDSPYTYFSSDELHLGEITLECSRPGASAAALWFTLNLIPLDENGLGSMLKSSLNASMALYRALKNSDHFFPVSKPHLDIVCFAPNLSSMSEISEASKTIFRNGMEGEKPLYLSLFRMKSETFTKLFPKIEADQDEVTLLRSVLMKPTHEAFIPEMINRLNKLFLTIRG